ncbi:MAG TPA: hypothetical protein VFO18_14400 [Methylomirabilota bacterium]|nr:hypothetical protein [Methylomirabilota bacterium]
MLHRSRALPAAIHLPLRKLALCLDCEECFEVGPKTCPGCGSGTWSPLARFLDLEGGPRALRAAASGRRTPPRRAVEEIAVAKHLLVVARHRRELYEQIKRAFAGHETVQVVLDRRMRQRRERKETPALERRRLDRRAHFAIDDQLRTIGWALVLLDLAKTRRG